MEKFDIMIVGAGISGISLGFHLKKHCPKKSFVIVEGRKNIGGTWDIFRYPGIRSDSDMYTFGFSFKPWRSSETIAQGSAILDYLNETIDESKLRPHIRLGHKILSASWASSGSYWDFEVQRQAEEPEESTKGKKTAGDSQASTLKHSYFRANMLCLCGGYYSYDKGYTPELPGMERFKGRIIHPQEWPEGLDYQDKRVLVIGSGSTAMTLVPNMVKNGAREVTMLQRSPTYVVSGSNKDTLANMLKKYLPATWAHSLVRKKNKFMRRYIYQLALKKPDKIKAYLVNQIKKELPGDYVDEHFAPKYNPWRQRVCLIPDADLFKAIREEKAKMLTGHIHSFTEKGLSLKSGLELEADIIITATGLVLIPWNNIKIIVDNKAIRPQETFVYKGRMFSGVPNMVQSFGYVNNSWTLRADLTSSYICKLIQYMDKKGRQQFTPKAEEEMRSRPFQTAFTPGYMNRYQKQFPKQGTRDPWINYITDPRNDRKVLLRKPMEDGVLQFTNPS